MERSATGAAQRVARRRLRRRGLVLTSGSNPPVGSPKYRSMRITGRIMTVADPDLSPTDFRLLRSGAGKLMIVPISLSPRRRRTWAPSLGLA
jgi:hypothetical protein